MPLPKVFLRGHLADGPRSGGCTRKDCRHSTWATSSSSTAHPVRSDSASPGHNGAAASPVAMLSPGGGCDGTNQEQHANPGGAERAASLSCDPHITQHGHALLESRLQSFTSRWSFRPFPPGGISTDHCATNNRRGTKTPNDTTPQRSEFRLRLARRNRSTDRLTRSPHPCTGTDCSRGPRP